MTRQIVARRLEHTSPEATALALWRQVELEDLATITERRHPIPTIADIADNGIAEFEHQQWRPARNREAPPLGSSTGDHSLELATGDNAPIGLPPSRVMHRSDLTLVTEARRANGYDRLDHGVDVKSARGAAARS